MRHSNSDLNVSVGSSDSKLFGENKFFLFYSRISRILDEISSPGVSEDPKVGFCRIFDADYDGPRDVGLQRAAGVRITCFRSFWGQK